MVSSISTGTGLQAQKVLSQNTIEKTTTDAASTSKAETETQTANLVFKPGSGFQDNNAFALVAEASADGPEKATRRGPDTKNGFDIFSVQKNGAQRQLQALLSLSTLMDLEQLLSLNATVSAPDTEGNAATESAEAAVIDDGTSSSAGSISETSVSGDSGGGSTGGTDTGDTGGTTTTEEPVTTKGNGKGSGRGGVKK